MFKNKLVIITGGSSGLGKALAKRLAGQGARLALIARDQAKLKSVREELSAEYPGTKIETFSCNVADFAAVEKTINEIVARMGPPDILINSAGVLKEGYFEKFPLEEFRELMDVNYFGALHCIKAALPWFKQKGMGRIVNVSSMGGRIGTFGYAAYCSSKFALTGLTEALRAELKPQNIKFHLVCPPEFESPMVDELNTYRSIENKTMVQTMPVLKAITVADDVIKGMEQDRYLIISGGITRILDWVNRISPGLSRAVVDYRIRKVYRGP